MMAFNIIIRASVGADNALSKFNMDYGILFSKRKLPIAEEERPCDDDTSC